MAAPSLPQLPITSCPDGAGSINNGGAPANNIYQVPYIPPDLNEGTFRITQGECATPENTYQENLASEALEISGAPVNIFKLLGVHEQGRLIDLTGSGTAIGSSGQPSKAFDLVAEPWTSDEQGRDVLMAPAWLGYDFGIQRTSYGQPAHAPGAPVLQHITSFTISQPGPSRVRQVRVERSNGGYTVDPSKVLFTGAGSGTIEGFTAGPEARPGAFMLVALSPTTFSVSFLGGTTTIVGVATVGQRFNSTEGSFTITAGPTPYAAGDIFTVPVDLAWYRVDVVNLPDLPTATISIKPSAPSRYWRLVPTVFVGDVGDPWRVETLQLFDYQATSLDNIQDTLWMENRDRDYARASIQLKASYQPFDGMSDLSKFGFQIAEVYTFTVSFAKMVMQLGRPIVVGDIIELPPELQYDHNLRPVRKFLEVSDVGWSAEGFTTGWKGILYKFTAQQLLPGQEHRDLLGTVDTQKYVIDDGSFFDGIEQIQTAPLTVTEANQAEAQKAVPEKGTNVREYASGTNRFQQPGSYDGVGPYVEDGLPPDGAPYETGFKLPDVAGQADGAFFRLEYDPKLNIAARLYKFSSVKNAWLYVETDRRNQRSAHKPSELAILNLQDQRSLTSKL